MIADFETNIVYFSDLLRTKVKISGKCKKICDILDKYGVEYNFLKGTKDIWARDYMPIQVSENKFIEYRYDPDYLQGSYKGYRDLKTYPDIVCDTIGLKTIKSDIILDGGNIVKSKHYVILTEKIVAENRLTYRKPELIEQLKKIFEVEEIVLIPKDKKDKFGHADGMLRFIDNESVLVSHYYQSNKKMLKLLNKAGLNIEFLKFKEKKIDKRSWAYLNFLQTKDCILLPKLGTDEDIQALEQIETYYPDYKGRIAQIEMNDIIVLGGALNCITWTNELPRGRAPRYQNNVS